MADQSATHLTLEVGKYYRTRDGRKVGPMKSNSHEVWAYVSQERTYRQDGTWHRFDETDNDLIAEWTDEPTEKPKTWGEMTDTEKGALLLADLKGEHIQYRHRIITDSKWLNFSTGSGPSWGDQYSYRVRPPEPKVETLELFGLFRDDSFGILVSEQIYSDTHKFTLQTRDGKPDCATIRMEEIQ